MAALGRAFQHVAGTAGELRVVSYNVLAHKYAVSGHHDHCPKQYLAWTYRLPKILDEIQAYAPDILCLQEVERPVFESQLSHSLAAFQAGMNPPRSAAIPGPDEGPCLFLRTSRFDTLAHRVVRFRDALSRDNRGAFWDLVREGEDGAVLVLCRDRRSERVMLAACTHLYHDPRFPDVKVAQAQLLCRQVVDFLREQGRSSADTPLVMGGDFNSLWKKYRSDPFDQVPPGETLTSGVYRLLASGTLSASHPDHPAARRGATSVPPASTSGLLLQSAYLAANGREPAMTNATPGFSGCLDYIWLSPGWHVSETLALPYDAELGSDPEHVPFGPIPDDTFPSDHVAIGCIICESKL